MGHQRLENLSKINLGRKQTLHNRAFENLVEEIRLSMDIGSNQKRGRKVEDYDICWEFRSRLPSNHQIQSILLLQLHPPDGYGQ